MTIPFHLPRTSRAVRAALLSLVVSACFVPGTAQAQTTSTLEYFSSFTVTGGHVVAGLDLPPQQASQGTVTGTIEVSGVPQDADVVAAYLYLEMIWSGQPSALDDLIGEIRFRGQPITAHRSQTVSLVGPYSPCWSNGGDNMTMLRADVLRLLPPRLDAGNKWTGKQVVNHADLLQYQAQSEENNWLLTLTVPEAGTGNKTPQVAGGSLLIVFRDPDGPLRTIVVNDGLHLQAPGEITMEPMRGFLQSSGADSRLSLIGGSGSPNATDQVLVNGSLVTGGTDAFTRVGGGTSDRGWSNPTFLLGSHDATNNPWPTVAPYGEQVTVNVTHGSTSPYDCLALAAAIFSTTIVDADLGVGDGIPDRLEDPAFSGSLKNPAGEDFPDVYAMGGRLGQRDLFVEIGAMKSLATLTQGATSAPFTNASGQPIVTPVPAHDHMPSATVLGNVIAALKNAGIAPHVDLGHARGVAYRALLNLPAADTSIIVGANLASGGESIVETLCVPDADTPTCAFPLFPGVVSWPMGYQYLVQSPVHANGDQFLTLQGQPDLAAEENCRKLTPTTPNDCGRRRFDRVRDGIFHYLLYVHARGVRASNFPCLAGTTPVPYQNEQTQTCPAGAVANAQYSVPRGVSGMSEGPGRYGMVSLGLWDNFVGTEFMQASTTVHELAHSLDIWHGGPPPTFTPAANGRLNRFVEPNCKPFYFSVTNYAYQAAGLRSNGGIPQVALSGAVHGLSNGQVDETSLFDASADPLPALRAAWYAPIFPGSLTETLGIGPANRHCDGTPLLVDEQGNPTEPAMGRLDASQVSSIIDWRGDGGATTSGQQDVNFDGKQTGQASILTGFDDHAGLALNQLGAGRNMGWFSQGLDLGGLDLGGLDLGGLDLGGLDLGGLDLGGLDLGGLDLGGLDLGGLDLGGLDLGGLDLGGLDLGGLALGGLDLGGLDLGGTELDRSDAIESGAGTSPAALKAFVRGTDGAGGTNSSVPDGETWVPAGEPSTCRTAGGAVLLSVNECHQVRLDWGTTNVGPVSTYSGFRVWDPTGTAVEPAAGSTVVPVGTTADGVTLTLNDSKLPSDALPDGERFIYFVRARIDGELRAASDFAVVTVTNAAPVANPDSYSVPIAAPRTVSGNVLDNDTDEDTPASGLRAVLVSGPSGGTLAFNADGSFTYTANADFTGIDSFTYKANNGTWSIDASVPMSADSNTETVTINVPVVFGFVNVQNLPPPANKTFKRGSSITTKWQFTIGGVPTARLDVGPVITITGPNGTATYSQQEAGHSVFKTPTPNNPTWQFNWQTINEQTQEALTPGVYTVSVHSTLTGQTFPATGTIQITLVK